MRFRAITPRVSRKVRPELESMPDRALLSVGPVPGAAAVISEADPAPAADRLLIKFKPGIGQQSKVALLAVAGTRLVESFPNGPTIVEVRAGIDPARALARFQSSRMIVYAEPNKTVQLADTSTYPTVSPFYPNDPLLGQQWGLNNANDVDIDAPEAWARTTGSTSTIVAVLDSGVDLSNPDLVSRLWVNASASRPRAKVYGWNFIGNNGNVQDNNGHGTHVTGILAGTGNNGVGIGGVDWRARIMPLKILGANGSGSLDAAVSAVYFAANHGARVISASWGSSVPDQALADAIRYAGVKGAVFVSAAGNDGLNNDVVPTYPAWYRTPNMLVVAAVDAGGALAYFSDFGRQTVDLAAPGVNVLSTYPARYGGYARLSGTSMATPFVAGVASLVAGLHPEWSAEQIVQRLLTTTKPLASLAGKTISGGIVDAAQAVGVAGSGPYGDNYPGPPVSRTSSPRRKVRRQAAPKPPQPVNRKEIDHQAVAAVARTAPARGAMPARTEFRAFLASGMEVTRGQTANQV